MQSSKDKTCIFRCRNHCPARTITAARSPCCSWHWRAGIDSCVVSGGDYSGYSPEWIYTSESYKRLFVDFSPQPVTMAMSCRAPIQPSCSAQMTPLDESMSECFTNASAQSEQWIEIYQKMSPTFKGYFQIMSLQQAPVQKGDHRPVTETRARCWKINVVERFCGTTARLFRRIRSRSTQ